MSYKIFLNVSLVSMSCLLIPSYGFAKGGKDLPLNERVDYYERKAETAPNPAKQKKYEKKLYQALDEKIKIKENKQFRKYIQKDVHNTKGVVKGYKPTVTMSFVSSLRGCDFREYLGKDWDFDGKKYQEKGAIYAEFGGHFQTVKVLSNDEVQEFDYSYLYALNTFAPKLEEISGLNMKQIRAMNAYGLGYLIHQYFDGVEKPQDGDLVVYSEHEHSHSGIFRMTNQGEVVESWWRMWNNPFVFQHDMFFVPHTFGSKTQFFRPKGKLDDLVNELPIANSMSTLQQDGTYVFDKTETNMEVRKRITENKFMVSLCQEFPEYLRVLKHIRFFGNCHWYAMGRVFGTYSCPSTIPYHESNPKRLLEIFDTYFEVTTAAAKGDLVLYYGYDPSSKTMPKHYGFYLGNNMVESKWGAGSVVIHPLFYVDYMYGEYVQILKMKMPAEEILKRLKEEKEAAEIALQKKSF